jgi:hypothetical protein
MIKTITLILMTIVIAASMAGMLSASALNTLTAEERRKAGGYCSTGGIS